MRTSSQELPPINFLPALRIAHPSAIRFNFPVPCPSIRAAVLDLGSNTFKLLLAEQSGSTLHIHHEKAYPVRLGQGVALTGKIRPATCLRALRLLTRFQRKILLFYPDKVLAVATGTLRLARNRQSFILPASRILGRKISLLTGHTEGRLIALAARQLSSTRSPRFHIDLGGGSLEVIDSRHPSRPIIFSLNLGCVAIRDTLLPHHPSSAKNWLHATTQIQQSLKKLPHPLLPSHASFSGGTGHAYACLLQGKNLKARRLEGFRLQLTKLNSLIDQIRPLTLSHLGRLPGMPADRASVALSAFLVLRETMVRLQLTSVQLTTHGLRYGVWLDQIAPVPLKKIIR